MLAMNCSSRSTSQFEFTPRFRQTASGPRTETILFATDLSETSRAGLKMATAIAQSRRAKLILLHVIELPTPSEDLLFEELRPDRRKATARLQTFVPKSLSVPFNHKLLSGNPATEIVSTAKHEQVSLIIVGTHQRNGLHRMVAGSIAEAVIRRAPCPVFAFPQASSTFDLSA
jgi:nucleotide-binding universal stress UspA family protein